MPPQDKPLEPKQREEGQQNMGQKNQALFPAIAISWDSSNVIILCPFCSKTHRHGITHFKTDPITHEPIQDGQGRYTYDGPSPTRCDSRVPHCSSPALQVDVDVEYVILFPFESDARVDGLSFELEQELDDEGDVCGERFRTVGLEISPLDHGQSRPDIRRDDEQKLLRRFQCVSLDDGDYDILDPDGEGPQRASVCLFSAAVTNDVASLDQLLQNSSNSSAFLNIRDKENCSLLGLASPNGHKQVVEYLIAKGSDVNAADARGRTPLMEASLFSHVKVVELLIKAGAERSMKDNLGMTARDLAEESDRNDLERHKRHRKYSEDPYVYKMTRRFIRALLGCSPPPKRTPRPSLQDLTDAYFYKSAQASTISFIVPSTGTSISTQYKTAAILVRPSRAFPYVTAISGFSGSPQDGEFSAPEAGFEKLNQAYWTDEALTVASQIEFEFAPHEYDRNEVPGSYYACHAEAQLMCFFVRKNYLFRDYETFQEQDDDFLQLFLLQERSRGADILVSNQPCTSCKTLQEHIGARLGINFVFWTLPVRGD